MLGQSNKVTVIECYRAMELSPEISQRQKKTKKVQKDVLRRSVSVSPPIYGKESVYTGTIDSFENSTYPYKEHRTGRIKKRGKKVAYDLCACHDDGTVQNFNGKYQPNHWDFISDQHGGDEVWKVPEYHKTFQTEYYKSKHPENYIEANDADILHTNSNKKYKRKSKNHGDHYYNQHSSGNPVPLDKSLISLYRKENKSLDKSVKEKSKFDKKSKPKEASPGAVPSYKEKCPEGICATAEAMRNKSFFCRCKKKQPTFLTKECTDATCKSSRNSLSMSSVVKLRDNILGVYRKYGQKNLNTKPDNNIQSKHLKSGLHAPKNEKKKEHGSEQTGEAFFEIQVNPSDMCVLNPMEIRQNIIKYGRTQKHEPSCICPSRGRLRPGEVCKTGPCKKAYKNKQTNFSCFCDKLIAECGDATCDVLNRGDNNKTRKTKQKSNKKSKHVSFQNSNKPLLEVQLDMDKMCVLNPDEIEDKIMNNITVDEICSSGICRDAALKHKIPFTCKCIRKKIHSEITECAEGTCVDGSRKRRSKFCLFCTRICSKSENWPFLSRNRDQSRIKRRSFYEIGPHKLCRGRLCTQSDNLHKNGGLYSNKMDLEHLPTCDCRECKSLTKPGLFRRKDNYDKDITTITKNTTTITQKKVNKPKHNYQIKEQRLVHSTPRQRNLRQNFNKGKRSEFLNHRKDLDIKSDLKETKRQEKLERRKLAQRIKKQKEDERNFNKELKRRAKLDKQGEIRAARERARTLKLLQKKAQEEPLDTNFCTAFILGMLKIALRSIGFIFYIIFLIIKDPKKCYWYVRDRIKDPEGTYKKLKNWLKDCFAMQKLQVSETVRGSDTLNILADHFMDTAFYESIAAKGLTKQEQSILEQKKKARKRRIMKRKHQAIHSCRHMLLTTLRHTPCLWVYHICPNFYPQCLSLLSFMRSFSHILTFLVAFACWTPCILCFELCRACLCCFMCTG